MTNFDIDLLDEAIKEAPSVGFGPSASYGKLTIKEIQIMSWSGKRGETRKLNPRPFADGDKPDTTKGEYLQVTLNLDIQELNPSLTFEWNRRVDIKHNSADGKAKTDWQTTVEPALLSVIGKDWAKKLQKGVYVEIENAETVEIDKNGKQKGYFKKDQATQELTDVWVVNTAPKVTAVYKTKAECVAARDARFAKSDDNGSEEAIPAKVIKDVKGLMAAGIEDEQLEEILTGTVPYSNYNLAELKRQAEIPF